MPLNEKFEKKYFTSLNDSINYSSCPNSSYSDYCITTGIMYEYTKNGEKRPGLKRGLVPRVNSLNQIFLGHAVFTRS